MGIVIIGQGSWGKRLATIVVGPHKTWKHGDPGFYINKGNQVFVAVPAVYLEQTLKLFTVDPDIEVISCTKGLAPSGRLPSEVIRSVWGTKKVTHLGGACVGDEGESFPVDGGVELETASVLKNVFAIGFAYLRESRGINTAAVALAGYLNEMPTVRAGVIDLFATCISSHSRNARFGKALAIGGELDLQGQVVEGLHTARMIENYNLYPKKTRLRNLTRLIVSAAGRGDDG